jgi:predicted nucleic acid-binding protein
MKIVIVVDANVILSALLGGSARFILFKTEFNFVTTKHTLQEVKKYSEDKHFERIKDKIRLLKTESLI